MLKNRVRSAIEAALDNATDLHLGPRPDRPDVRVEYARDEKFGDYACTIAMDRNFRDLYAADHPEFKNPRNFAGALAQALRNDPDCREIFAAVDVAGPGFLNLTLTPRVLFEYARLAAVQSGEYGRSTREHPRKILFEFVSANPTGPLNVVSARAAALGDACCRLLAAAGEDVTAEYYVNDHGNQVNLLGESCLMRYLALKGIPLKFFEKSDGGDDPNIKGAYPATPGLPFPSGGYHGEYIKDVVGKIAEEHSDLQPSAEHLAKLAAAAEGSDVPEDFLHSDPAFAGLPDLAARFGRAAIAYFLESQQADLKRFRVDFANFFRESTLHESGAVLAARDQLGDHVYKSDDGKTFFRSTDFGDDKDRVIVRDDGRPTYLLADIAYHRTKIERGFSHIYNIWGPDHHGYIARLAGAMRAMDFPEENFRVLIAQQVKLLENKQPIKMSKRAGQIISMAELIDDIPIDVSRYFFVMRTFDSHLDFDLAEARDESDKNPYYYVAYAHARIQSIFRETTARKLASLPAVAAGDAAADATWAAATEQTELTAERRRLLVSCARFTEEIHDAALAMEPHRVTTYLYSLATALSQFYGQKENKVIDQTPEGAAALLGILQAVGVCLKNGLALLGMIAPDRMERSPTEDASDSE
ncbi:MAG: arginine--tRNA ligase [bacterium]|nr:arginine--tRNA ligase [bacterium]